MAMTIGIATSCNKELKDYDGQEGLYFDAQWGNPWGNFGVWAHQIYSPAKFGSSDITDTVFKVKIVATGAIKDYDRPFLVIIDKDSTNAILNEDYSDFVSDGMIKAGETTSYVSVTMHKTERMQKDTVVVLLRLLPNEHFTLPFTTFGKIPGRWDDTEKIYSTNEDPRIHKIIGTDILSKPKGWWGISDGGGTFGKWTATKYRLFMDLTNTTVKDYADNSTAMPSQRAQVIKAVVAEYLTQKMEEKDPVMDEGDVVMWVNGVKWAPNLKREDLDL